MQNKLLKKIIPLTLSAGMLFSLPAAVPQYVPTFCQSEAQAAAKGMSWNFTKDLEGWKYGGKWAYKGKPAVNWSSEFGGTIKLDCRPELVGSQARIRQGGEYPCQPFRLQRSEL